MSARLIKQNSDPAEFSFAPLAIPEADVLELGVIDTIAPPVIEPDVEAERIISEAKARAQQIELETRAQMQTLIQAEVEAEVARVVNPWREGLKQSVEELAMFRSETVRQTESELVRLALAIARKVIHREVKTDPEVVVSVAREALSRIQHRIPVEIHVNPDDFAYLKENSELLGTGHSVTLVEDKTIGRGGCLIHADTGEVDARIDQQFDEIESALLQD